MKKLSLVRRMQFAIFFPLLFMSLGLVFLLRYQLNTNLVPFMENTAKDQTAFKAKEISRWLDSYHLWLQNVRESPELKSYSSLEEIGKWMQSHRLVDSAINTIVYVDKNAEGLVLGKKLVQKNLKDRSYYKELVIKESSDSFTTQALIGKATGRPIVIIAYPVKNNQGKVKGLIALAIRLDELTKIVFEMQQENGAYGWVVDGKGTVIAHKEMEKIMKTNFLETEKNDFSNLDIHAQKMIKGESGSGIIQKLTGESYSIFWSPIPHTPNWVAGYSIPKDIFFALNNRLTYFFAILIAIELLILIVFTTFIVHKQLFPIGKAVHLAKTIANGKLDSSIDTSTFQSEDEIGELMKAMHVMATKLRETVHLVTKAGEEVATESNVLKATSQMIASGSEEQTIALNNVTNLVQNITNLINESTKNSEKTLAIANEASSMADDSSKAVSETVHAMDKIAEKVSVIQTIAGQTRLLSLNASIEAARAGTAGKGFAVVASEVSKLAEISSKAAKDIDELTKQSVSLASTASHKLSDYLFPKIKETTDQVDKIATFSENQKKAVEQINASLQNTNTIIKQNTTQSQELSESAEIASKLHDELLKTISYFKL